MTCSLRLNEKKILQMLVENKNYVSREIAKSVELNEVSVRRIINRLKQENILYTLNIPNFPALGYKVMMVQRIYITSPFLIETKKIMQNMLNEWSNCIDCHETYDGKILARSVWKSAEEFKNAHAAFYRKFGTEWLQREHIDMIPLDEEQRMIRVKGISL